MYNVRYIRGSAEREMFFNDQWEELRNAMTNIRKATKAGIPLHDFWTAEQIFEKPPAIAAHRCNIVNDKIVWDKSTRVPMLSNFTTTSTAHQSGVPKHMVKYSDARMATTLIPQEDYDRALEGSNNQFVPLRRLSNGLVPFVGLRILRALPFKLDLDEDFYDIHARRETQRQTLKSVLQNLKAGDNVKITDSFIQTVADVFGPRAMLGPFLDSEGIEDSTPAIYTTYPTSHNTFTPSDRCIEMIVQLGYDKCAEGALLCRLADDEQSNARWMGVNVLFALPFKVHIHPAVRKAFQNGSLKLPPECFDERSENVCATSAQEKANLFAYPSALNPHRTLLQTDAAGSSSATVSHNTLSTEPMSAQTKEPEAVEHQESTLENANDQSSAHVEQPSTFDSNTEQSEGRPIARERDREPEGSTSPEPAPTQAAAPAQYANTTTSECMLPNCPRPMNRAEVRRTHLVTHYGKWHGMPVVQRVYGGNWAASNDAQDAIIVPWLRGLGVDPASIKLNGEVVFKG